MNINLYMIMITGILIGLIGGFLGIFYRTCLKAKNMIFNFWYSYLSKLVDKGGILKFIAYPLGYCIYCSTTWITFILCFIYLTKTDLIWQDSVLLIVAASGVQHLVVAIACRFLISGHPDIS